MDALVTPKRRISPVERAAKATSDAVHFAVAALVENVPALDEATARTVVIAIRAGLVAGVKMEVV